MQHGGVLPLWCEVIIAAEAWGTTPWAIAGDVSPNGLERIRWMRRLFFFNEQRAKARK